MNLIVSLTGGAIGGNMAGAALKEQSFGLVGNLLAGTVGGGVGGMILQSLGASGGGDELNAGALIGNIAGAALGGGLVLLVIGFIKAAIART